MDYKKAVHRLSLLKGQVRLSKDYKREVNGTILNVAHAQERLWSTLPESYFETFEALSELHGIMDPSLYFAEKDDLRKDSTEFMVRLTNKVFEKGFTTPEKIAEDIDAFLAGILSFTSYDFATLTRYMVQYGLYAKTIKNLGTERHHQQLIDSCALKSLGCYGLTELGHGSNVRGMEITAEYDKTTKEFVLNSPTKTAIKFWIGGLAKVAFDAVMFAQLHIEENGRKVNKGVHAFLMPIRDRQTHTPFPGLEIGDCGHKKGLNGVDNGWIRFENYRVPREALLNKFGDVREDGSYHTPIENDGKRFANSIASLTGGRVNITRISSEHSLQALVTAIRYAGVRRQFGENGNETLLLDYPLHQYRLITRFAENYIGYVGANRLVTIWSGNIKKLLEPGNTVTELCHALSSNMKAFIGWKAQETIAECRKACGGNGYSHYAMFGLLLDYNDLHATWEGDSNVLLMQTQKYLLKAVHLASKNKPLAETLDFLKHNQKDAPKFTGSLSNITELTDLFAKRASHLAITAAQALATYAGGSEVGFSDLQPFELRDMCQAYHDIYNIDTFNSFLTTFTDSDTKGVYENLLLLYIHNQIVTNSGYFINVFSTETLGEIKAMMNKTLKALRKEIIVLTQTLPFPNRALGPFGNEDMQIYDRFIQHFKAAPKVTERPDWWRMAYSDEN